MADTRITADGATRITADGDTRILAADAPVVPVVVTSAARFSMVDVLLGFDEYGGDLVLEADDLAREQGLISAIVVSLFSDARAEPEESPGGGLRGWWPDTEADRFGSKLWLLGREKTTNATVVKAREWTREALAWLIEDGICEAVDIEAERIDNQTIGIRAILHRGTSSRWETVWQGVEASELTVSGFSFRFETA